MATLRQYFEVDFANALTFFFSWQTNDPIKTDIAVKVGTEIYSAAKFVAYYVPSHPHHFNICCELVGSVSEAIKKSRDVHTVMSFPGEVNLGAVGSTYSVFSKRIYIYAEGALSMKQRWSI